MEATNQPIKYKRIDVEGGVLTNQQDIDNYITIQHNEIRNNYMLGDYNEEGGYFIDDKILKALVNIPKIKLAKYENTQFLTSIDSFKFKGSLQFCVVTKKKDGKASSVLKLLETINKINGYIQNTNSFVVAIFTDNDDENFEATMEKIFNIHSTEDFKGNDEDINIILNRILFLRSQQLVLGEMFNIAEEEYYEERLQILQQPEYADILIAFKKLLSRTEVFLKEEDINYYSMLNELLDQAIDETFNKNPKLKETFYTATKSIDCKHNQKIKSIEQDTEPVMAKLKELQSNDEVKGIQKPIRQEFSKKKKNGKGNNKKQSKSSSAPIILVNYKGDSKGSTNAKFTNNLKNQSKEKEVETPQSSMVGPMPFNVFDEIILENNNYEESPKFKENEKGPQR